MRNAKEENVMIVSPVGAEYAKYNPSGEFIERFYCIKEVKFNDGTVKKVPNYLSSRGVWMPSSTFTIQSFMEDDRIIKL